VKCKFYTAQADLGLDADIEAGVSLVALVVVTRCGYASKRLSGFVEAGIDRRTATVMGTLLL